MKYSMNIKSRLIASVISIAMLSSISSTAFATDIHINSEESEKEIILIEDAESNQALESKNVEETGNQQDNVFDQDNNNVECIIETDGKAVKVDENTASEEICFDTVIEDSINEYIEKDSNDFQTEAVSEVDNKSDEDEIAPQQVQDEQCEDSLILENEEISSSEDCVNNIGADISNNEIEVEDNIVSETSEENESVSVTNENGKLKVFIKGLSEEETTQFVEGISNYFDVILTEESEVKITWSKFTDAEKYMLSGYDSQLCWAATAANMLWNSGYAQIAEDPRTESEFENVDEVFDYFRGLFTDVPGVPDGALSVVFKGEYPYEDDEFVSQIKEEAKDKIHALLPDENPKYGFLEMEDPDEIQGLDYINTASFGALLKGIDPVTNINTALSHWLTVAGFIRDDNETQIENQYKAIIFADSDNSPANDGEDHTDEEKAELAAKAPNTVTAYPLKLQDFGEKIGRKWTVGFENKSYGTIFIDCFCYLLDRIPAETPEEEPEQPSEDEEEITIPDTQPEDSENYESEQNTTPVTNHNVGFTGHNGEKQKNTAGNKNTKMNVKEYDYTQIKEMMVKEDMLLYNPDEWHYSISKSGTFDVFVRTSKTLLQNVFIDDQLVTEHHKDFTTVRCSNGIFYIAFSEDFMNILSEGEHTLRLQIAGAAEDAIQIFNVLK